jgi:hypothetical protein
MTLALVDDAFCVREIAAVYRELPSSTWYTVRFPSRQTGVGRTFSASTPVKAWKKAHTQALSSYWAHALGE